MDRACVTTLVLSVDELREYCVPRLKRTKPHAPSVRAAFAKRLREQRIQGGYVRARNFAKVLGIEENTYTRYERAEAEPNLTLIHKICEVLRLTPDALFGFDTPAALELKRAMWVERFGHDAKRLQSLLRQSLAIVDELGASDATP